MNHSPAASAGAVLPREIVQGIANLDPLPATAQRLIAMLVNEDESLADIAGLLESDQAIVANVLRRANAAWYGSRPASTVLQAVLRLGTVSLLDLMLDGHLRRLLTRAPAYGLNEHDLWVHGAAAQIAVRALRTGPRGANIPAVAECAGLLHDVGKLIIARYLRVEARDLLAVAREQGVTFTDAERRVLGFDHTDVGAAIADHWGFPEDVAFAIRHHHHSAMVGSHPVLDAVMLANLVAKANGAGLGAEGMNFTIDPSCHRRLNISRQLFDELCFRTHEGLAELQTQFIVK